MRQRCFSTPFTANGIPRNQSRCPKPESVRAAAATSGWSRSARLIVLLSGRGMLFMAGQTILDNVQREAVQVRSNGGIADDALLRLGCEEFLPAQIDECCFAFEVPFVQRFLGPMMLEVPILDLCWLILQADPPAHAFEFGRWLPGQIVIRDQTCVELVLGEKPADGAVLEQPDPRENVDLVGQQRLQRRRWFIADQLEPLPQLALETLPFRFLQH